MNYFLSSIWCITAEIKVAQVDRVICHIHVPGTGSRQITTMYVRVVSVLTVHWTYKKESVHTTMMYVMVVSVRTMV